VNVEHKLGIFDDVHPETQQQATIYITPIY